ncbi:MAG TPA: tRNA preQ1(34) S-adenosylmethionine ribosyltransferase-isomerase QueA [Candidatus Acidoferrales bacterium]|nr:tRNA preQ1(34) S-adenosylmethionine ribosyltransferase-isomerase QueA [Candidatus Acidoferrales bacterium]
MELKEFLYDLPPALIAAEPEEDRSRSRLMVIDRRAGTIAHRRFAELGSLVRRGDLLVLNDTRVLPARLRGKKATGGSAEVLLVEPFPNFPTLWIALIDASKKPRVGSRLYFSEEVSAEVIGDMGKGRFGLKFRCGGDFEATIARLGEPPLPPYIERQREVRPEDWKHYQTVYSKHAGSVAAPTAGFHFTEELLEELRASGIETAFVTLHVGPGTFRPVREQTVERHRMEGEWYRIERETAEKIQRAKACGRRVIAVGTTTTRALEWSAQKKGRIEADEGIARLYIYPGFTFRVLDGLITNFHLPASTPLLLVAAFMGVELTHAAYAEAIRREYRFYSYGDAMLIL